jgi:DNA-binding NtrC family response regulator
MNKGRILLIDDEELMVESFTALLSAEGYDVEGATTGQCGLARLEEKQFDVVLCDLNLPDLNGMDLLQKCKTICPETVFIIITAYGSVGAAVKAMKDGAYDFICKPLQLDELLSVLDRALERIRLIDENRALREAISERYDFSQIIGQSKGIRDVLERIRKVIDTKCNVLITGESGTGKELIARAIHYNSPQAARPFVVVNCGAIPRELLESELFGHEKGAFTGASSRKKGLFEEADGGTLFLDEIGDLPPELQVKLLRAVQDGEIRRVGGTELIRIDCRIVAATNQDLRAKVDEGRFRADLYYRLNVVPIHVPPLRERSEDIPLLVEHLLQKYSVKLNHPVKKISQAALELLMRQPWQGNVRELENILERAILFSTDQDYINVEDLPASFQDDSRWLETAMESRLSIEEYTRAFVQRYESAGYQESEIARLLGISPKTLWEKRKRWGRPRRPNHSMPNLSKRNS